MTKTAEEVRAENAERARLSRQRRKWKGTWLREMCRECGEPSGFGARSWPFEAEHREHATLENTVAWVDGVYVEPKVTAAERVVVPKPPAA